VDALLRGAGILQINVLWEDLHIAQRGFDVGVTHQPHERRLMPARIISEAVGSGQWE
jgi:hypothetical protein